MADALTRATLDVSEGSLQRMALDLSKLPSEFGHFELLREGLLDNDAVAEQSFPGTTADGLVRHGRITGFLREFAFPGAGEPLKSGVDVALATVVHLFQSKDAASAWISDVFLRQFKDNVGKPIGQQQTLVSAQRLRVRGFHDEAEGVRAVQHGPSGLLSTTVVDFCVGRILGVAYLVTAGDVHRRAVVERIGGELERQIVRVVLGAS